VFESDKYFHGRPSATTAPDPNDSTKTVPLLTTRLTQAGLTSGRPTKLWSIASKATWIN